MSEKVIIFDTTLRDGEQSPGASMNTAEKLRLAVQLEKLGVDVMEAGFPAASEGDFEAVSAIAEKLERVEITGLARTSASILHGLIESISLFWSGFSTRPVALTRYSSFSSMSRNAIVCASVPLAASETETGQ